MITCPCCSNILLRHLNSQKVTWFCLNCRQEMPIISLNKKHSYNQRSQIKVHKQLDSKSA